MYRQPHRTIWRASALSWSTIGILGAVACSADHVSAPKFTTIAPSASVESNNWGQRGRVVDATVLRRVTKSQAAALLAPRASLGALQAFEPHYDVDQYSMSYTTINEHGEATIASAGVFVPIDAGSRLPLVSFSHGTQTDKQKVPSTLAFINPQGIINAAHGSVAVLADYVGMGVDEAHIHPYLVAQAGADASLDALRAARRLLRTLELSDDGRLFIYGYSQGGQVAMALAREIEIDHRSGFKVTAAAPASGPYAFYEIGRRNLALPTPTTQGSVPIVYLMASFQAVYHVANSLDELLISPEMGPDFPAIGQRIVTSGMTDAEVAAIAFPPYGRDVLQPAAIEMWLNEPNSLLSRALRANETYDWQPRMPMRLYYGAADVTVDHENALIAASRMTALGAADVKACELVGLNGEALNHNTAQWPSYIAARRWFDTFPAAAKSGGVNELGDDANGSAPVSRTLTTLDPGCP